MQAFFGLLLEFIHEFLDFKRCSGFLSFYACAGFPSQKLQETASQSDASFRNYSCLFTWRFWLGHRFGFQIKNTSSIVKTIKFEVFPHIFLICLMFYFSRRLKFNLIDT
jgi:hypothetical protein